MSYLPPYRAHADRVASLGAAASAINVDGTYGCIQQAASVQADGDSNPALMRICMKVAGQDIGSVWLDVKGAWVLSQVDPAHKAAISAILAGV